MQSFYFARRAHLVFFSIFLCLCLRIFLRRFLMTEPKWESPPIEKQIAPFRARPGILLQARPRP